MDCFLGKQNRVRARVVRRNHAPCLLAMLATANPPLVWQFDLEKMSSYAIRLREIDGEWDLGYEVPQGSFTPVARFDERADAEAAYRAVQKALARDASPKLRGWGRVIIILFVIFALLWMAVSLANIGHVATTLSKTSPAELSAAMQQSGETKKSQQIETGVPMSADDVLPPNVR